MGGKENDDEGFDEHYRQILYAHRRDLILARQNLSSEYTKSLVALSGGAIGLSLSLISGIFGTDYLNANFTPLYLAWTSWCLCIVLVLVSIKSGQFSFDSDINHLDSEIGAGKSITYSPHAGKFGTISNWSEIISGLSFLFGIVAFIIFVVNNS